MNPTAIVELTENCNMACDFCLRPSFTPPIIKLNTLENIIRHVIENSDLKADFIWHGGEPLLAGLDIFQQIPLIQQKYNSRKILVNNNVQTNGTKLSPEFIDFFQSQSFAIGTSIQGTKETHDISRVTIGKKPTYDLIVSNIGKLSNKPASILVLTTKLLGKEEEIYYSTKPHVSGIRVSEYFPGGLNPAKFIFNSGNERPEPLMPTPREFGESMIKFYEVWKNDKNPIGLKPITEIIRSFVIGRSEGCLYSQVACTNSVFGVKSSGEFYTCIRGAPENKFSLGFFQNDPLVKYKMISEKNKKQRVSMLKKEECGNCRYWDFCNGGCPLESWKIFGDLDHKTWYCEGRKMLFNHILADLT